MKRTYTIQQAPRGGVQVTINLGEVELTTRLFDNPTQALQFISQDKQGKGRTNHHKQKEGINPLLLFLILLTIAFLIGTLSHCSQ